MSFTFTADVKPTGDLISAIMSKGIIDPGQMLETANKIVSSIPAAELDGANDADTVSKLALKYLPTYFGNNTQAPDVAGAPAANVGNGAVSNSMKIDLQTTPGAEITTKSRKLAESLVKDATARSAAAHIESLILTAPAPKDRFKGVETVTLTKSAGEAALKRLNEYQTNGQIVPDGEAKGTDADGNECANSAAFAKAKELAKQAAESTDGIAVKAYINDKARATVGGYKIQDGASTVFAPKSGYSFHGMLAKTYGTYLKPATGEGSNGLGAYLSKRDKVGGKAVTGLKKLVVKVIGMKQYLEANNGDVVYEPSATEKKNYNVKTKLSFKIYKTKSGENGTPVVDKTAVRTIRLSGIIEAPTYQASAALSEDMKKVGIKVSSGAGVGSTTVPTLSEREQVSLMAETMSILAASANAGTNEVFNALGSGIDAANAIRDMINGVNTGNPSGEAPID